MTFFLLLPSISPAQPFLPPPPPSNIQPSVHSSWDCLSLFRSFCPQPLFSHCWSLCWPPTAIHTLSDEQSTIIGERKAVVNRRGTSLTLRSLWHLEDFSEMISSGFLPFVNSFHGCDLGMGSLTLIKQEWRCKWGVCDLCVCVCARVRTQRFV